MFPPSPPILNVTPLTIFDPAPPTMAVHTPHPYPPKTGHKTTQQSGT